MLTLIMGENKSGKSDFAERYVMDLGNDNRVYLATMIPYDDDGKIRIQRHRKMREGRGFETVERGLDIAGAPVGEGNNVLLEDLCNLVANEIFEPDGRGADAIPEDIAQLYSACEHLTIVSNTFFSNKGEVSEETKEYISKVYEINERLKEMADNVIRIEGGNAIVMKGSLPC